MPPTSGMLTLIVHLDGLGRRPARLGRSHRAGHLPRLAGDGDLDRSRSRCRTTSRSGRGRSRRRRTSWRSPGCPRRAGPGRCTTVCRRPPVDADRPADRALRVADLLAEGRVPSASRRRRPAERRRTARRGTSWRECGMHWTSGCPAPPRHGYGDVMAQEQAARPVRLVRRAGRPADLRQLPAAAAAARLPAPRVRPAGARRAAVHHHPPGLRAVVQAAPARGDGGPRRDDRGPSCGGPSTCSSGCTSSSGCWCTRSTCWRR